jgi:NTP pyrophosphatase (non-canonical NTP hydrolase)
VTFNDYQLKCLEAAGIDATKLKVERDFSNLEFLSKILGLSGEVGEVSEKFKKIIRDGGGKFSDEDAKELAKELGDVLWYVSTITKYIGFNLEELAEDNIAKLNSRKVRGKLSGSGDNR